MNYKDDKIIIKEICEIGQVIDRDVCGRLKNVMEIVASGMDGNSGKKIVAMCEMTYDSLISISNNLKSMN